MDFFSLGNEIVCLCGDFINCLSTCFHENSMGTLEYLIYWKVCIYVYDILR